jgi:hypothetical protein
MVGRENNDIKKPRGRPVTTGKGYLVGVRLHDDILACLDAFASAVYPFPLSRQEAIRQILRERLTGQMVHSSAAARQTSEGT